MSTVPTLSLTALERAALACVAEAVADPDSMAAGEVVSMNACVEEAFSELILSETLVLDRAGAASSEPDGRGAANAVDGTPAASVVAAVTAAMRAAIE